MKHEFTKIKNGKETRYVLDEFASGSSTSAASVGSGNVVKALGGVRRRTGDNLLAQEGDTVKVPVKQKPRQGALRTQTGAGAHKDKKKAQKQGQEKHRKPYMEELKDRISILKSKLEENDLAQQMLDLARSKGMPAKLRGSPDQERERTQQMQAQRAASSAEQERNQLPELKAQYSAMKKEYDALGGGNWQYADRDQNMTDAERRARDLEPELQQLAARIRQAEQGVAEGSEDLRAKLDLYNEKAFEAGHRHDDQAWRKYTKAAKQIADQLGLKYKVTGYGLEILEQGVAEAGPFGYGKAPRKGSVADLAAKKRQEQEKGKQPIEPKDQQVGVAKVTKGVAEGSTTPKVTFAQSTPGSWAHIDILVNGVKQFVAAKTIGPGFWSIFDLEDENIGSGSNKSEIKSVVLDYLSKQGVAETDPGISKNKETKFHAKLDRLVHNTFGKRKDEVEEDAYLQSLFNKLDERTKK